MAKKSDWLGNNKPCKTCKGTGRVGKDTCPTCRGFGY